MRKSLIVSISVLVSGALLSMIWIAASAYMRAPRLVADLERAGVLEFAPSELTRSRLCALIVVQDPTFYRHQGIALADGSLGHTTITQSIGKGLFFAEVELLKGS